ncbi:MAG: tRNA lysidine(34) synthetase TilS, partial [Clostridia bacterium]|nr:tRNA lysidine(34) synthetase TilS [Clostridia bacterium]
MKAYAGKKVCVACSGGADSVALLHAFHAQADEWGISLSAVTCEHGIRGASSLSDLAFVRQLCKEWGIPLFEFSANVPQLAEKNGRGLEEEGRAFRYRCFEELVARGDADVIATAHHRDDLAETVLFRLARGTSLAGVDAIKERAGIVRPLLSVSKAEILNYVHENGLPFVTDETNGDEKYSRNAIRIKVLPALEEVVKGAGEHIADFARRAGEDDQYLQTLALAEIKRENGEICVPVTLPRPLFFRAVVAAIR